MNKKLVTFGDSFIAQRDYFPVLEPKSWIDYVCQENSFTLDGYGVRRVGIDNTIVNFINYKDEFDICIFAWSDIGRPFYVGIDLGFIRKGLSYNGLSEKQNSDLWKKYYRYHMNHKLWDIKAKAFLEWFDKYLQDNFSSKKIYHLNCFEMNHKFYKGINIKTPLIKFSKLRNHKTDNDTRLLHMAPKVHKLFANQLNKSIQDKSLKDGDVVEFSLEL